MAILTSWGPLYHCTIEKIGYFGPLGPRGAQGPKYPDFLYCTVVEGCIWGCIRGAPRMHPLGPLYHCVIEKYGVFRPPGPRGPGVLNTPYFSIVQWYRGSQGVHLGGAPGCTPRDPFSLCP